MLFKHKISKSNFTLKRLYSGLEKVSERTSGTPWQCDPFKPY